MKRLAAPGLHALALLVCIPAYGHGFGARYDLPLPLPLWVAGAAATVVLSFVVAAWAVRVPPGRACAARGRAAGGPRRDGLARVARAIAQALSAATLVLIVVAGWFGDQTPSRNLAPTAIWIAWWVGFSYLCAFVADVWPIVDPWSVFHASWERLRHKGVQRAGRARMGEAVGVWPATALFLVFAWLELVWQGRAIPAHLAVAVLAYSLLAWSGMSLFGRATWSRHADPFGVAFAILGRFAPLQRSADGWSLHPPGAGLLYFEEVTPSLVAFVVIMLSTVTFDGLMATPLWRGISDGLYAALTALGPARLAVIDTAGLLAFCAGVALIYRLAAALTARASQGRMTTGAASRAFVLTLVPIAIAYLVAHYLSYTLIQGQFLIRLASDPLGFGWNLFGTAGFRPDIGLVGARFVWYTSLVAIVLGHVVAVALAHLVALRTMGDARSAVRSQVPMLVLMVAYTMMSLWIVAQPIVE